MTEQATTTALVPYTTEQAAHHAGARQLGAHNAAQRSQRWPATPNESQEKR